jgi:hypothetical protein
MTTFIRLLILAALCAHAPTAQASFALTEVDTAPTSLKTRVFAAFWESLSNSEHCHPDAITFKIKQMSEGESGVALVTKAAELASSDGERPAHATRLLTQTDRQATVMSLIQGLGNDSKLPDFGFELVRMSSRMDAFELYAGSLVDGELDGDFIAIVDQAAGEILLLTSGDAYKLSRCD